MKVTISVMGRLWAFYLAHELQRHQVLRRLITSYPKFETVRYGVERKYITSLLFHEVINRAWRKLPKWVAGNRNPQYILAELFDRHAKLRIPEDTDLFVGWSSVSLYSLRKANELGVRTILERGSSHMLYQTEIMTEEYERFGLKPVVAHRAIVERELLEYEEADFIAIPSQYVKRTFLEKGVPESKLIHVPYGVNLEHFRPIPKQDDVFRVIFCGQINLRKGVHYLLQAFAELRLPHTELWLIGSVKEEIKPFLSKYAAPNIILKGHFSEMDLHKYYSQGSIFCLSSIEEGLAMVQAQAMACGLPVICTTNTGGEDIVRNGQDGFIIPIRDVEALKEKIQHLYENRDRCKKMGASALERVRSGFSWQDYGDRMVAEYESILSSPVVREQR